MLDVRNVDKFFRKLLVSRDKWNCLLEVCSWILPYRVPAPLRVIALLLVVIGFLLINVIAKKKEKNQSVKGKIVYWEGSALFGIFIAVYLGFLLFTISFIDAAGRFDDRYLSPIYGSMVIVILDKMGKVLLPLRDYRIVVRGLGLICIAFLLFSLIRAFNTSIGQYKDGAYSYNNRFNFNSRFWNEPEIIKEIRKTPSGTLLFTNVPEAIYIITGRSSYKVPYTENAVTKRRNEKYLSQLEAMDKGINSRGGLLVYFDTGYVDNVPSEEELNAKLHLILYKRYKEGTIYKGQK